MNKVSHLISQSAFDYPQLKWQNYSQNLEISLGKKVANKKNNQSLSNKKNSEQKNSFTIFKYLILTTSIVFTFGGLGFGLALRCGQDLQISQFAVNGQYHRQNKFIK